MIITFEGHPGFSTDVFFRSIEAVRLEDSNNEWEIRYNELSRYAVSGSRAIVTYEIVSALLIPLPKPAVQPGGREPFIRHPRNVTVVYRAGGVLRSHTFV